MFPLSTAWKIVRNLGPKWVLRRIKFAAQQRFGILERRLPVSDWGFESHDWLAADRPADPELFKESIVERSCFFLKLAKPPSLLDGDEVCRKADRVLSGEWPFFSHLWSRVGFPPDWQLNALDGTRVKDRRHWSRIDHARIHDVKFVWEPSRFSPVYLLVRAYCAGQDERYAEAFWKLVEDWAENNPPNLGVNWISGQEAAFRVMAWCFGLYGFFSSTASTPQRVMRLVRMIEKHGERIDGFIEYALSQRNNHGISEATALFAIGILFPQLHRAKEWSITGRNSIVEQLRQQVYEDGSYIQHSFNYQRVMIDNLLWAFRLGELNHCRFPDESYHVLAKSARFMLQFCNPDNGRMPNCGGNDGSLVLPFSSCDYTDFRPSIQATCYLTHRELCFGTGKWNEMLEWMFGSDLTKHQIADESTTRAPSDQYLKLTSRESYCLLRAARYRDRPAHADQLHLDLWWRGESIACDAGTHLYNGAYPWTNALARTTVHNTITVDRKDQMTRAGRFLWLDWAQARSLLYAVGKIGNAIEASHDGYRRMGVSYRRSVLSLVNSDAYIVVDDVAGAFSGNIRLHWLFPDYAFTWQEDSSTLILQTSVGLFQCVLRLVQPHSLTVVRAGKMITEAQSTVSKSELEIRGWRSLYYGEKEPAISVAMQTESRLPVRCVTVLSPADLFEVAVNDAAVKLRSKDGELDISLQPPEHPAGAVASKLGDGPVFLDTSAGT